MMDWHLEISLATSRLKHAAERVYQATGLDGAALDWEDVQRLEHAKDRIDKLLAEAERERGKNDRSAA